jgi:hypothetical protein
VGAEVIAAKVVEHWRATPELLEGPRRVPLINESWLDEVLTGTITPSASAVAFLLNLELASATVAR